MVIRSARGPFDCFHFSNLTLEVVVYHKLYLHLETPAQLTVSSRVSGLALAAGAATVSAHLATPLASIHVVRRPFRIVRRSSPQLALLMRVHLRLAHRAFLP